MTSTTTPTTTPVSGIIIIPPWINDLSDAVLKADFTSFFSSGSITEAEITKALGDLASELTSSGTTLSASQFNDLESIAANISSMGASGYLQFITNALVNGNSANAYWTGGYANYVWLGNLTTGFTAGELNELTGKWFLGTDLPSCNVSMSGYAPFTVSYSNVSSPLYGAAGPTMSDINQGYLGDCYFVSSLAEVAYQEPSAIESMITNNGNGTYGVRFYVDGQARYVTVDSQLADGGTIFNKASNIWASLVEQAYAEVQAQGVITGDSVNYGNSFSTIGNGGDPKFVLEEVTGASTFTDYDPSGSTWTSYAYNQSLTTPTTTFNLSTASVVSTLAADVLLGDDLVVSSNTTATDSRGFDTLIADHDMSIYGYDASTGMLEIRNPWGVEPNQYWDTTFEVSLNTLLSDGDSITTDNVGSDFSQSVKTTHANDIGLSGDVHGPFNLIDMVNLEASYGDLINAFGTNQQAMQNWYATYEPIEQRPDTFDGLDYVATYPDLINAFKNAGSEQAVLDDGATHFIEYGVNEGRTATFNGLDYIASYGDLIKAFGVNGDAGAYHYIEYGANEGRTTTFDGLEYIASYGDLIRAFGANEQAGAEHFIGYGYNEGRTTSFDGLDYIAGYTDLMKAFGANADAGATHYIDYGLNEGRSADPFNVGAYESAHPDLIGKYANNDTFLCAYINTFVTTGHTLT